MSIITEEQRQRFYEEAQAIDPTLGDIFKGGCVLTMEEINAEMDAYHAFRNEEMKRWKSYADKLAMLMCFPEQNHKL